MGKGPGLFSDIGKRTKDLLNRDFATDQKLTVTSVTGTGLTFTTTGNKKGEQFAGSINTHYKFRHARTTLDVKVDTGSNIHGAVTTEEIVPGAKAVFSFTIPDQKSGKVEVQYNHQHIGLTSSIDLSPTPIADMSVAIGNDNVSIGGQLTFNTARGKLSRYNAGIGLTKPDFSAAILVSEKGDTMRASYSHIVNPVTKTTLAAEATHKFSKKENTFTIGAFCVLDSHTSVKARLNNHGQVGALLQHEWRPKSLVTICGEVDTKALNTNPKIGLALALSP